MAIIPSNTQFVGDTSGIPIIERRSGQVNALSTPFTMEDIIETVGGGGGVGLEGTDYVYVAANGTPEENAVELQAAYDLAKVKVDYKESIVPYTPSYFYYGGSGYLQLDADAYADSGGPIQDDVVYELLFDGVSYFASTQFGGMFWEFVDNIYPPGTEYTTLEILVSAFTYNLVTVVVAPGKYSFDTDFLVDTEYVSITSLTGNADVLFTGNGTINVTANDILLKGIDTQDKPFTIATNLDLLKVESCIGGFYSFVTLGVASGTFTNCVGGEESFGSYGTASGTFRNCIGNNACFGAGGTASGIFTNCETIFNSSGFANGGTASGTFLNCRAGAFGFGAGGTASGIFKNCISGDKSFGDGYEGARILSGKLYYCTLTSGTFLTVSGGGRTYYCVDGNGNTNNQ